MANWYYKIEDREVGPLSEAELKKAAKSNAIVGDTPVRRDGMSQWVKASKVNGLFVPHISCPSDDNPETSDDPLLDVLLNSVDKPSTPPPLPESPLATDFYSNARSLIKRNRDAEIKKRKDTITQALGFSSAIITVAIIATSLLYYFGGGLEREAARELQRIEVSVAEDAIKQYEIAKRSGSAMEAYTQASFVAAAYLQAKDEVNYLKWVEIRRREGRRAGLPAEFLD